MCSSCGVSNYSGAMLHLFTHAFFKGLLFPAAGAAIHSIGNGQNVPKVGGLNRVLPLSYIFALAGSLSLMGWPFYTGYYSKDIVIHTSFYTYLWSDSLFLWVGNIGILSTTSYSTKLLYLVFIKEAKANKTTSFKLKEGSKLTSLGLIILALASILIGYFSSEALVISSDLSFDSLYINKNNLNIIEAEYLIKPFAIQFIFTLWGLMLSLRASSFKNILHKLNFYGTSKFIFHKFYIDYCINIISTNFLKTSQYIVNFLDLNLLNFLGPRSFEKGSYHTNRFINLLYSGNFISYLLLNFIVISVGLILLTI